MKRLLASNALLLTMLACGGDSSTTMGGAQNGGTLIISTAAEEGTLFPPHVRFTSGKSITSQIFDRLADMGPQLNTLGDAGFTPRLATGWKWSADSLSITFSLNPAARWHDGAPVRASDVAFTFGLYRDPTINSDAASYASIDSVSAPDSLTAVFWFARRYPEQFYSATYDLRILPQHLLGDIPREQLASSPFARNPVGSGPFRFARWEPGASIELIADTLNYHGRPGLDRVIIAKAGDMNTAIANVFSGDADFFEVLRLPDMETAKQHPGVRTFEYPGADYVFLSFNFRDRKDRNAAHPLLSNRAMRIALSMATNRDLLVRSTFDTLARLAKGPFVSAFAGGAELRQIPYDSARAAQLLDSLGWRLAAGKEFRARNGRELRLGVLVPIASATRMKMATLLQAEWKKLGIRLDIEDREQNVFGEMQGKGDFDISFIGWHVTPSAAGLRQTWYTRGVRGGGGSNLGSYSNAAFDALVDSVLASFDNDRAAQHLQQALQLAIDDAPAIWMYEPRLIAAIHPRLRTPAFPADGWWTTLAEWRVAPGEMIERDQVGLKQATH